MISHFGLAQIAGDRSEQQDVLSFAHFGDIELYVVADGMGGHQSGAKASSIVVEAFVDAFAACREDMCKRLRYALNAAQEKLSQQLPPIASDNSPPGTTLAALILSNGEAWHLSVGDSLIYVFRDAEAHRLNEDHSMSPILDQQAKMGLIDPSDVKNHPQRGALRSAIVAGASPALVDCPNEPFRINANDRFCVMSDGLLTLSKDALKSIIKSADCPQKAAESAVAQIDSLKKHGQDNASLVVVFPKFSIINRIKNYLGGR